MHVCGLLAFRQQDVVEPRTGLDHLDDIAAAPGSAKAIDTDGNAAPPPVEVVDRGDRILPRLWLQRGDHGVFEIEEDGVG